MKSTAIITPILLLAPVYASFSVHEDLFAFPKYQVKYVNDDFYTKAETAKLLDSQQPNATYELLKTPTTDYLCAIPKLHLQIDEESQRAAINQINNTESLDHISQLISDALDGRCFLKREVFWTYTYCHRKELSQSHGQMNYNLGKYDSSKAYPSLKLSKESGIWLLSHYLTDGTICDLTGETRSVELQYVCNPETEDHRDQFALNWIHEYRTCQYAAQVHVPQLCSFDLFKDNKIYNDITCQRIIDVDNHYVEKQNLILDQVFVNHNKKVNIFDYNLEKVGKSLFVGHPTTSKEKLIILIDTAGPEGLSERFGQGFYRSLRTGKLIDDPSSLLNTEFVFEAYVYDKNGDYVTTLITEQTRHDNRMSVAVKEYPNRSNLESNFILRVETDEPPIIQQQQEPNEEHQQEEDPPQVVQFDHEVDEGYQQQGEETEKFQVIIHAEDGGEPTVVEIDLEELANHIQDGDEQVLVQHDEL